MTMRIGAALVVALLALAGCDDDGASVRDLGGSASGSGTGSGTGSATGVASGSPTGPYVIEPAECEPADPDDPALAVTMDEYRIKVEENKLTPGPTRFHVTNEGEDVHELVLVAMSIKGLPIDKGRVDEDALTYGRLITEIPEIRPGETCALKLDLEPDPYVFFCNIRDKGDDGVVNHFREGMRKVFKVT